MRNFSEISNEILITDKSRALNEAARLSGLPMELLDKMYENHSNLYFLENGNLKGLNEDFIDSFIETGSMDSFDEFVENIKYMTQKIGDPGTSDMKREAITDNLIKEVDKVIDDSRTAKKLPKFLEVICFILYLKNRDKRNRSSLNESVGYGLNLISLLESDDEFNISYWNAVNLDHTNFQEDNANNVREDLRLYSSLRERLTKYSTSWAKTPQNNEVYEAILSHIDMEISDLVNSQSIQSVDLNMYADFFNNLFTGGALNVMYHNTDYLKKLIPDLQTFMFDLMLVINGYVTDKSALNKFLDLNTLNSYRNSTKILFDLIASSNKSSYLRNNYSSLPNNYRVSLDCLLVIKAIQNEFNINIRKSINSYVTKTMEILQKLNKLDLQLQGRSMYHI